MSKAKLVNSILLYGLIEALPGIIADWHVFGDWQWWAFCTPFWILIGWRDTIKD